MVLGVVARVLLGYPGRMLGCCYAVARIPGVVARVLLCGCYCTRVVTKVLLCGCYCTRGGY